MLPGSGTGFQSFVPGRELPPGVAGDFAGANRRASLVDGSWEYVASPGGLIVGTIGWANPATKQITNYYQTPAAACFIHRESQGSITQFLGIATMSVLGGARPIGYVAGEFWGLFAGGATAGDKVYANAVTGALTAAPHGNAIVGPITSASITSGVLDVLTISGTPLAVKQIIAGVDVPPGTYIASLASGSGGTGTYNLANVDGTAIANVTAEAMNYYGALETQFVVVDDAAADCDFTGSLAVPAAGVAFGVLTVTAVASGALEPGQWLSATGLPGSRNVQVLEQLTGVSPALPPGGGTGTYLTNNVGYTVASTNTFAATQGKLGRISTWATWT